MSRNIFNLFARRSLFALTYNWHLWFDHTTHYRVMSVGDTIRKIQNENLSLIRFGDGELVIIRGRSIPTQKYDPVLSEKLKNVLCTDENGVLIAIPDIFCGLDAYQKKSRYFWQEHLFFCRKFYRKLLNINKLYGNAFFSRGYLTLKDHTECRNWFDQIKKLWEGKNILLIEGKSSYNGVGNDLFLLAKSIRRIICKPKNCYENYNDILDEALRIKSDMILLSVGATTKPLAMDLFHAGHRVIDIGNLNTEYIAFCHKLDSKEKLAVFWDRNACSDREEDQEYRTQIIKNFA